MQENLVGYLLKALEPDEQEQIEKLLEDDPQARQQLETLKRALEPLEADQDSIDPPSMLAYRTLARIAEHHCQSPASAAPAKSAIDALTPAPASDDAAGAPSPAWWRQADVLMALGLLIAVLGVGIPGLSQYRQDKYRQDCKNNLFNFHQAFADYANSHGGQYPGFDVPAPHDAAGMFVPALHDAGVDVSKLSTCCPGNGSPRFERRSIAELQRMTPEEFEQVAPTLSGCYAYTLGYRDPVTGQRIGPRRSLPGELDNDDIPVMADQPSPGGGNSDNHRGGQNVLHVGGHVTYHTSPTIDDDHIFLNKEKKVKAGLDRFDTVLGPSAARP